MREQETDRGKKAKGVKSDWTGRNESTDGGVGKGASGKAAASVGGAGDCGTDH